MQAGRRFKGGDLVRAGPVPLLGCHKPYIKRFRIGLPWADDAAEPSLTGP